MIVVQNDDMQELYPHLTEEKLINDKHFPIFAIISYMNPFGYNLKSRCRNRAKRFSNRPVSRNSDAFGYNERSEVIAKCGGVGGLLAVSVNGIFSIPCYDHNGNIVAYISETGGIKALYGYDAYGNTIEQSGEKANEHSFGFSTKYHDRKVSLIAYQKRFYRPDHGRWLNRDPIGEEDGENLYAFCLNNPTAIFEKRRDIFCKQYCICRKTMI